MKEWMRDKKMWLFDLAHDNLDRDGIVKGFIRHYALTGQMLSDVQRDLHFHTLYGDLHLQGTMLRLKAALEAEVDDTDSTH